MVGKRCEETFGVGGLFIFLIVKTLLPMYTYV